MLKTETESLVDAIYIYIYQIYFDTCVRKFLNLKIIHIKSFRFMCKV